MDSKIPKVEFEMLIGGAQQLLEPILPHPGIAGMFTSPLIQGQQNFGVHVRVGECSLFEIVYLLV